MLHRRLFLAFTLFICSYSLFADTLIVEDNQRQYFLVRPGELLEQNIAEQARDMYFDSYDTELNKSLSLNDIGISHLGFATYEDFRRNMFEEDFASYVDSPAKRSFFYVKQQNEIVGVAAVLSLDNNVYYIDHIGIKKGFQHQGIGSRLLGLLEQHLENWKSITLDTRVFNTPAQQAYEKAGFQRVTPHPIALKDRFYIRYEKNNA